MPAPVVVPWSPEGVACVGIPVEMSSGLDYSSLEVLWPETPHTPHKLCYCMCPPFEGDQHLFSRCINTSSCDTHYSLTVNSDSVCFAGLQHELTSIPVYFTLLQPCRGDRCIIRSLLVQYSIIASKCIICSQQRDASEETTSHFNFISTSQVTTVQTRKGTTKCLSFSCRILYSYLL